MSRPSFQFYPGDWSKNANLRRCSPAARGVWVDILCLLHDSEAEYGVLRWPLKDVANAASAPMPLVKELVAKGVLKGADKGAEPYVYRPKHAGKVGEPVILVAPLDGPVWFSSRFVRDEYVRQRRGESTRFDTENQPQAKAPKASGGTERARLRAAVLEKTGGHCHHCRERLGDVWEIDHFIPRAKGGSNLFSNLVPACVPCNQDKADNLPDDWEPSNGSPTRRLGERQGDGPSSSSSSSQETSEANASAADAAAGSVDNSVKTAAELTKSELWRAGKSLLQQGGMPTAQCGTFVGKLVKDYGDELVIDAVRSAVVAQPADAATYLKATCMRLKGERKDAPPPATVLATGLKAEAATQQYLADHVMTPEEEARAAAARAEFLAKHKGLKAPEPEGQPQ